MNVPTWIKHSLSVYTNRMSFVVSFIAVLAIIYQAGFNESNKTQEVFSVIYFVACGTGMLSMVIRHLSGTFSAKRVVLFFDGLLFLFCLSMVMHFAGWQHIGAFDRAYWLYLAIFLLFIREFSDLEISSYYAFLRPAQLFVLSFLVIILVGTSLLILPNATYSGISLVDALFTATSAVCVTGLIVVDTGSYFTLFGQSVILFLIQAGGIGIMTFTSYFSYFFRGRSSYESQLLIKDLTNSDKIGGVFNTLKKFFS